MFDFKSSPNEVNCPRSMSIIRVPASGTLDACILNEAPVCHAVHWCEDRTIPHTNDKSCPWCEHGNPPRIEVYIGVWITQIDRCYILTLTDYAAQPMLQHRERFGKLRGRAITANRPSANKNGKILVGITGTHELADVAPIEPDIAAHLSMVWEINLKVVSS
ncbi:unnamed protein product, partial [marine sediment metagenome]